MWPGPDDQKVVGAFLSDIRREQHVTQVELANRLGKPQSFVSSYEIGQRRVDFIEFTRISYALGVDPLKVGASLLQHVVANEGGPRTKRT